PSQPAYADAPHLGTGAAQGGAPASGPRVVRELCPCVAPGAPTPLRTSPLDAASGDDVSIPSAPLAPRVSARRTSAWPAGLALTGGLLLPMCAHTGAPCGRSCSHATTS